MSIKFITIILVLFVFIVPLLAQENNEAAQQGYTGSG